MFAIALSEIFQMVRNRAVLITTLIIPLLASAYFIYNRESFNNFGSSGYIGAMLVFTIGVFSLYAGSVTILAARRQNLFLKRLRSSAVSDPAILSGLVMPISLVSMVQVGVILIVFAAVTATPADLALLVVAIVAIFAMALALGMATAGLTSSPEQAQVTTLPLSLGLIGVSIWIAVTGTESMTVLKRLVPGGSATELVANAWDGGVPLEDSLILLAPTLAWVIVAVVIATKLFRWEPRR